MRFRRRRAAVIRYSFFVRSTLDSIFGKCKREAYAISQKTDSARSAKGPTYASRVRHGRIYDNYRGEGN